MVSNRACLLLFCRYATELATTLRRGGFEAHTTSDLEKRKAGLLAKKEAQQKRNDPQITHTIADLAAIQLVSCIVPSSFLAVSSVSAVVVSLCSCLVQTWHSYALFLIIGVGCCVAILQVLDARQKALVRATRDSASARATDEPDPEML